MTDEQDLDAAKRDLLRAERDIEQLRLKIATDACPLKVGDVVKVRDGDRTFHGQVERIHFALAADEMLRPVVGAHASWAASGRRFLKDTRELGKWTFAVDGLTSTLVGDEWVLGTGGIASALGLP